MKNVLSIAGVDPSGGAGSLADIKTFVAHRVYAMGVITAVTSQNTQGIYGMQLVEADLIKSQIEAIFNDIKVDAIKIGVVPTVQIIQAIATTLNNIGNLPPIVLDPVMACKNGNIWLEDEARKAIATTLAPLATIITPNIFEAMELLGRQLTKQDLKVACEDLLKLGCKSVCLKAGEIEGRSVDIFYDGDDFAVLSDERLDSNSTHGSGCALSSAIAANLAEGFPLKDAVSKAKDYVFSGIKYSFDVGRGCNPINHFFKFK
ncbi:MAG: bifunctional hydroxymethylpyrimidine kinase/phosphomethylpyrimidine kinase [Campylobacter sp.]|nr:bifunctional hydroxymethylpyrimidine kinase/phosphomethylpyrimidine kinase [Campylobacter sp.]